MAPKGRRTRRDAFPALPWVDSAAYESTRSAEHRRVDPAPLRRLLDAWSAGDAPAEGPARELAEDATDGPIHLVRLVAALETTARRTGGSLTRITDTPAVTSVCGGTLHHLVEVLHSGGLAAATGAARAVGSEARFLTLSALRPYWLAPLRALCGPLHDMRLSEPPWRS
jgi:hypothetical protein